MGCRDSESSQELFNSQEIKSPKQIVISDQASSDNENNQTKLTSIDSDGFNAVEDKNEGSPIVENSTILCENTSFSKIY